MPKGHRILWRSSGGGRPAPANPYPAQLRGMLGTVRIGLLGQSAKSLVGEDCLSVEGPPSAERSFSNVPKSYVACSCVLTVPYSMAVLVTLACAVLYVFAAEALWKILPDCQPTQRARADSFQSRNNDALVNPRRAAPYRHV